MRGWAAGCGNVAWTGPGAALAKLTDQGKLRLNGGAVNLGLVL